MGILFSKATRSIAVVIGLAATTIGDGFMNSAQACTPQVPLSETQQKLAAIGSVFTLQQDGSASNRFGFLASQVRSKLITLGIPETEIIKGDKKVGKITITPEGISSLPPLVANNTDQALIYASDLSKIFNGLKTEIKPYYTADMIQPVNYKLEVNAGMDYDAGWRANVLSDFLIGMQHTMGIKEDDLTIDYREGRTTFDVGVKGITQYDKKFGTGAFMKKLNSVLSTTNENTGNSLATDLKTFIDTGKQQAEPSAPNCL